MAYALKNAEFLHSVHRVVFTTEHKDLETGPVSIFRRTLTPVNQKELISVTGLML
jgi:hypothetical protein